MSDNATLPELAAAIKAAEDKYADLPKGLLEKLAAIESKGGRSLVNPKSSARGPFQFMEATGPEFGLLTEEDRMDFNKSTDAAARLLLRNKKDLERRIGRPATQGELYLAHQQGARGAANLLTNADKLAAEVVGDPEKIRLNGGDPSTMTAGAFATKWTSKIDGGSAPGKKSAPAGQSSPLGRMPGVMAERDFYDFDPKSLQALEQGSRELGKIKPTAQVDPVLAQVPTQKVSSLAQIARGNPERAADEMTAPADEPRQSRTGSAILQGLSTFEKTAQRLAAPLAEIAPVDLTETAPSGIPGTFSQGVEAGLQNMNADQQYFGAIIDTLMGNEKGAKSRIFNAQQFEADSAQALSGMQTFEEFLKEPTFDGFISQVVSSAGQVAPSALDTIANALVTGGMYSLLKTGISAGSKTVAKVMVKDIIKKQAKGKALDNTEKGIIDALYKNFKFGAATGAFGSEYRMMSGEAFAEFGDAGVEMDAERAMQSLLIGVPQAALGVGGEYAILKSLAGLATKKATRSAETSILKKFAQDVTRKGVESGLIEGATEAGQEAISIMQRASVDPTFTLEDAQLRLAQATFAGFFGGGAMGGGAAIPVAGVSAARGANVVNKARDLLKGVSESRVEAEVNNETTGVDDEALAGKATPESGVDIEAQMFSVLDPKNPKKAAFIDPESAQEMDVEPGKVKKFDIKETEQSVYTGHIPGKGVIASADPDVVAEVMTVYEMGGDVDAAIGEALGMVGGKEGDNVVRVKNADGAVIHEQVADDETLVAAATRAEEIAAAVPGAQVDIPDVQTAMEERHQKATLDRKEFNAEASALLAMREMLEAEDDKTMDEKAKTTKESEAEELSELDQAAVRQHLMDNMIRPAEMLEEMDKDNYSNPKDMAVIKYLKQLDEGSKSDAPMLEVTKALPSEIKSKSMRLESAQGDALLTDNISSIEKDTSYENLKAVRDTLRKEAADSLNEPKPAPRADLSPAEIHSAFDRQEAEVKRRVSIERAVSLLNDAIDAHEIAREDGALSPDLQRVITRRAASAVEALKSTSTKSKSMKLGDEPSEITPEEQAQLNEITDPEEQTSDDSDELSMEEQLAQVYAEIDKEAAVQIQQFPERTTNRDPEVEKKNQKKIDELWLLLSYVVPEEQYENYKKFKDRMPIKMLEKLIALNEENNNDDSVPAYYDVADDTPDAARGPTKWGSGVAPKGQLSITKRDIQPNADTTVTRDAVREVIKQVAKMPGDMKSTLRKTVGKGRANSMFWLVNRNTGKAYRLNGTPKTKNAKGRTGIAMLAQAGVVLNARTQQALSGKGLTPAQTASQGFMTMLKALTEAGYDFKVGKVPSALIPFDPQKLPAEAKNEPVITIAGIEGTITDLLYVKAPFEASKSDFDANERREELTPGETETKSKIVNVDGERRIVEDVRGQTRDSGQVIRKEPDPGPEFARAEDKKKKLNNVEDELADSAKRDKDRKDEVNAVVAEAAERGLPEMVESDLDPIPADVTIEVKKVGKGWQAVVSSPRFERQTVTSRNKAWVEARAHALAVAQPDTNPIQYNRLALETTDATEKAREAHPEILGVPPAKNQSSIRDEAHAKTGAGTNKVVTFGNLGPLTTKILSTAMSKFNFHKPVVVMTLKHILENFDALTGEGGKFARAKEQFTLAVEQMLNSGNNEPGRTITGGNQYLIILRDEVGLELDANGEQVRTVDDAEIGAVLAHELGHAIFKQEYDSVIDGSPLKQALWTAYTKHVKSMVNEGVEKPDQYTNDRNGFEEWYSDQVMAYVYNEARQAKGIVEGYFKRIAKAIMDFFGEVNRRLGGRLKLSREKIPGVVYQTPKGEKKQGTFPDYMDKISERDIAARQAAVKATLELAKKEALLNNDFTVLEQMQVKSMILNLQGRTPGAAQTRVQNAVQSIMATGRWGRIGRGLMNIVQASQDFMNRSEHGQGGANLARFFGTYAQSTDKLGWNKRELFSQNQWNNKLAKIFGFDDRTDPKEWDSPATRAIMIEAMNEDIADANLSTPEAKAIRDLYKDIVDNYLKKPGGGRAGYYVPDFVPRANYGGPRMWNVDKIAKNKAAFVAWLAPQIQGDPEVVWESITTHTQNQVQLIERTVEQDIQNHGRTNVTPVERATLHFIQSMNSKAVTEMRDRVLRDARRGVYTMGELLSELQRAYPSDPVLASVTPASDAGDIADTIKRYWLEGTRKIRLTPGMDPALERKLAADVKTIDAYNADPNDPNGWLLPPALAHAQYMHYIARRVEFEKMGIERGARTGVEYVIGQLDSIPEEYRAQVDEAIMANLGKFGENMSNGWRALNSVAAVWTVFTTLLFTTLSSVTDMAGIATRSKDFNALGGFINGMKKTLTEREFQDLARAVGVVTGRTQEHMMIGQGELDYANKTARSIMNGFFRYTGLEFYTKFTRSLAVGMGREFIVNTANSPTFGTREERYLAELGLTREDVQQWLGSNQDFSTPHGEKVRTAIARFADEAVIRPDASQRPTWASNPYLQTVWQLKSYYYGFGKTVLGGLGREIKNRYTEDGNFNGAAQSMMLYATTIIPLTMFGMASRDWIKWLFQLAIPGVEETASASMKLDTTGYMWEIFKRSGTMGPFALGLTTMEAFKFEGIAAPFTANVPMFDLFDDTIFDGDLTRPLPVINNIK